MNPRHGFNLASFFCVLLIFQFAKLEAQVQSNLKLFNTQADSFINAVLGIVRDENIDILSIRFDSSEAGNFIKQKFLEKALLEHLHIIAGTSSDSIALATVSVPVMMVSYSSPIASHLFGSSEVVRTVRSSYSLNLLKNSQFIYAHTFSYNTSDTISEAEIRSLEIGEYSFVHGSVSSGSIFNDVIQPILFAGAAAVVVYLFFALRGG